MQETKYLSEYPFKMVMSLSRKLPFFSEIFKISPYQFEKLVDHCKMVQVNPGEVIIKKNEMNCWIYFVLQGVCYVFAEKDDKQPLNLIGSGSMFGELAVILDLHRTAYVTSHPKQKTILVGVDAAIFRSDDHSNKVNIEIKILFYRGLRQVVYKKSQKLKEQLQEYTTNFDGDFPKPRTFRGEGARFRPELLFYEEECVRFGHIVEWATRKLSELKKENENQQEEINRNIEEFLSTEYKTLNKFQKVIQQVPRSITDISVLIANGNEKQQEQLLKLLKNLGITTIHQFPDGYRAWNFLCNNTHIDVIISAVELRKITGLELLQKVTFSSPRFHNPVFIIATDNSSSEISQKAVKGGVHGYIIVPFTNDQLLFQLQRGFKNVKKIELFTETQ
ncbi:MAG: response regulator [SAR324 cluster bacterium]|nr:response regulator [SAR324 cluster bacterium]